MSTKLWSSFLCWNCISGCCISPTLQIWIADSGRKKSVQNTKFGTWCTKWVQNYNPVFYVGTAFGRGGGCISQAPQIWIADSARKKVYKIWDLVNKIVQIEYKIMIHFFYVESRFGAAACQQPLKFQLRIAEEGRVYKILDLVYKIVQNKYKIMIYFSLSKSVLGARWHAPLYFHRSRCYEEKRNVRLHFKIEFIIFIFSIEKRKR